MKNLEITCSATIESLDQNTLLGYIYLCTPNSNSVAKTIEVDEGRILLDLDELGALVGIEICDRERMPHMLEKLMI